MKYNVHVYALVRCKVVNIEADSHKEAIKKAEDQIPYHTFQKEFLVNEDRGEEGLLETEYAQENPEFLVDEVGNDEYENSKHYKIINGEITEEPCQRK